MEREREWGLFRLVLTLFRLLMLLLLLGQKFLAQSALMKKSIKVRSPAALGLAAVQVLTPYIPLLTPNFSPVLATFEG